MKKTIKVELSFAGNGKVLEKRPGYFTGGVKYPKLGKHLAFSIHREVLDEDGVLSPILGELPVEGAFQINIEGDSKGYRELARYLLGLAELDSSADKGFHEHHENILSGDGRTRLHIIVKKRKGRAA
jgi:hypothetical protein